MTKEIYISNTPHETRLAVVEDDQLAEIYYERENEYTLAGSVYKGKVTRVLPGMQSAFVDIGLERDAFLYVTDFAEEQEDGDEYVPLTQNHANGNRPEPSRNNASRRDPSGNPQRESTGSSPAEEAGEASPSGGRRWRGRRGRRRGRGGAPQQNQPTSVPLETTAESHSLSYGDEEIGSAIIGQEADEESVAPEHFTPLPAQPEHSYPSETMVLPGESLSKYRRGEPSEDSGARRSTPVPRPSAPVSTFQPSTMVTGPLAWDGSDTLPGESISRHKNRPLAHPTVPETQASEPVADSHTEAPATFASPAAEASADAETDLPQTERMPDWSAHGEEPLVEAPHEPAQFEPERASASYRFDPSAPSAYRQSSVAEPPGEEPATEESASEELVHESPADRFVSEIQPETVEKPEPFFNKSLSLIEPRAVAEHHSIEQEIAGEDDRTDDRVDERGMHVFDPGHGTLEEETLDDEENENDADEALLDDEEYDDLIEETLDMQMDSGLIGELVRDQHIEERTHFQDDSAEATGTEETGVESEVAFNESMTGVEMSEMEELEDIGVEEADEANPVDADTAARTERLRGNRRGFRGRGGDRHRMRRSTAQTSNLPAITELLKPNQEILVQIAKEPIARKGARITSHIALPGRFLVFMPTINHVGVSRKISSDEQRQRLKHILLSEKGPAPGGFIVRTAAATASEEDLRADIRFLLTLWAEIKQRADSSKPPALIYHDLSLVERVLRDQVTDNFSAIWVDSEADYERVLRFLNRFEPSLVRRVKLYTKETPLFEQFGLQEEINKALRSKVWLKSGGSIVINQTEALVAIDINTGKYVGKTARLEDTILKTNLDAIPEIVRQIRLRDLGGIIVIDFIDMDERKNRAKVMQALEEQLKSDRAPSKVLQFNDFGLVAITRKRVKQSLERTLSVPCSVCTGTGMVKGPVTVCNEIYVELRKMHKQIDRGDIMLRVNPEVVKQLKSGNGKWLSEMEEMSRKTIIVKSDATLHPEQFDIH